MIYQRGQINVASVPTLSGKFLLYQETDETSRPNNWRGIFAPDLSNTTPDGELLTFTLADGLGGQLTLAGLVGDMWLVERAALEMK